MIRFRCDCGAKLKSPPEKVGAEVGCPQCLARITVPVTAPLPELDLAEVDDTLEPLRRRRPRVVDDDDSVDELGYPHTRSSRRSGFDISAIAVVLTVLGFVLICFATCIFVLGGREDGLRGLGGREDGLRGYRILQLLMTAFGSICLLGGTVWGAVIWGYHGNGERVKLARVAMILGCLFMLFLLAMFPLLLIFRW